MIPEVLLLNQWFNVAVYGLDVSLKIAKSWEGVEIWECINLGCWEM